MLQVNNTFQFIDLFGFKFSSDDVIQVLQTMKSNSTLTIMNVVLSYGRNKQKAACMILIKTKISTVLECVSFI